MGLEDMVATVFKRQLKHSPDSFLVTQTVQYLKGEVSADALSPRYKRAIIDDYYDRLLGRRAAVVDFCKKSKYVPLVCGIGSLILQFPLELFWMFGMGFAGFAVGQYSNLMVMRQYQRYRDYYDRSDPYVFSRALERSRPKLEKLVKKHAS